MNVSLEEFEDLLARASSGQARLLVAQRMMRAGFSRRAEEIAREALAAPPDSPEVRALARAILARNVPYWHFGLVQDTERNDAYELALKRTIRPGMRVLEIGAGTGLLAMMAARAGAVEVITCEANPTVAETARGIIAQNGYDDRVSIVAKHSDDLKIGVDLPAKADMLVSEIIANNLFAEHALPAIGRVQRNLLADDGIVIPAVASVRIALAEAPDTREMGVVSGFDLSAFNGHLPPHTVVSVGNEGLRLRSAARDLFRIDFQSRRFSMGGRARTELDSLGGRINAVVQWLYMDMDGRGTTYENRPAPGRQSAWASNVYHITPVDSSPGDMFVVEGTHDVTDLRIWARPR